MGADDGIQDPKGKSDQGQPVQPEGQDSRDRDRPGQSPGGLRVEKEKGKVVANGNYHEPLPGWLGSVVQVTTQVGVPTVFAGVLLWFVLFRVGETLDVIEKSELERIRVMVSALDKHAERFEAAIDSTIEANRLLAESAQKERAEFFNRLERERTEFFNRLELKK